MTIRASITDSLKETFTEYKVRKNAMAYLLLKKSGTKGIRKRHYNIPFIDMYDLLLDPYIGTLSAIKPYTTFIVQGKLIIEVSSCISAGCNPKYPLNKSITERSINILNPYVKNVRANTFKYV